MVSFLHSQFQGRESLVRVRVPSVVLSQRKHYIIAHNRFKRPGLPSACHQLSSLSSHPFFSFEASLRLDILDLRPRFLGDRLHSLLPSWSEYTSALALTITPFYYSIHSLASPISFCIVITRTVCRLVRHGLPCFKYGSQLSSSLST